MDNKQNITHIELDLTIFNKPKIKFFKNDTLVEILIPKKGKEYELFKHVVKKWTKELKKNKKIKK